MPSSREATPPPPADLTAYAMKDATAILNELGTSPEGITDDEAGRRRLKYGANTIAKERELSVIIKFLSYFTSPLVIILLLASGVSAYFGEMRNAIIIWIMTLLSVVLDFFEEHSAGKAAKKLQDNVRIMATVVRNGQKKEIHTSEIVPGDVIFLSAGNLVPADARIIEEDDCFVNQSALTGESLPSEKHAVALNATDRMALGDMENILFFGTSVITGTVTAVVFATGSATEFGKIAEKLVQPEEKSEFELGVISFGYFIMKVILFLTLTIFFVNTLLHHQVLESFMFAVAIAVGVTPELLPMIMSITMARGSIRMSKKGVIVKKLSAIPSFGSMNVLCTDKTGTLTEDNIRVNGTMDADGKPSDRILLYAYLNSTFQTGITNPLDRAIAEIKKPKIACYEKTEEIPFDFQRKMMSVAVKGPDGHLLITKGAPEEIWARCSSISINGADQSFDAAARERAEKQYADLSSEGLRVLAIAIKRIANPKEKYTTKDESGMEFVGFISFLDPPKKGVKAVLKDLQAIGIDIKIITGDNELVTEKLCRDAGLEIKGILLGQNITTMTDDALRVKAAHTTIFARFSPDQKNRIIHALRSSGNVVGYIGDGINDAPSLRNADVGISVSNALDVARESADMVMTQKSLKILKEGILEGRKTFGNTMKYILMGLSSNFGNMFSMLAAVFFLPYLPMLPVQILLNNLLYDCSQITLPMDNVDKEWLQRPRRWNFSYIKKYMFKFGPVSSIYDVTTYLILFFVFHANASTFQTGWFMESLATQSLVIHVIRTQKLPFIESKPSPWLLGSTFAVVILGWIIPYTIIGDYFKFSPLPWYIVLTIVGIVLVYLVHVEIVKRFFFKKNDLTFVANPHVRVKGVGA